MGGHKNLSYSNILKFSAAKIERTGIIVLCIEASRLVMKAFPVALSFSQIFLHRTLLKSSSSIDSRYAQVYAKKMLNMLVWQK